MSYRQRRASAIELTEPRRMLGCWPGRESSCCPERAFFMENIGTVMMPHMCMKRTATTLNMSWIPLQERC